MKQQLFLSLLFLICTTPLTFPQSEIGVYYAPNLAFIQIRILENPDGFFQNFHENDRSKYGNSIGLIYGRQVSSSMTVKGGFCYATKGSRWDLTFMTVDSLYGGDLHAKNTFRYVSFPLTLKYQTQNEGRIRLLVETGLAYNLYLSEIYVTNGTNPVGEEFDTEQTLQHGKYYNRLNLSYLLQAGISYDVIDQVKFNVGLYSDLMLTNYLNLDYFESDTKAYLHNIGLKFGLSYML